MLKCCYNKYDGFLLIHQINILAIAKSVDYNKKGGAVLGEHIFCYRCMEKFDSDIHICPNCGYDNTTPHNPMYITPGTILHDRYLVGILLEYNGEGATYAGHDISTGCKVLLREYMPINLCSRVKNKRKLQRSCKIQSFHG